MKLSKIDLIRLERLHDEGVVDHPASILEVRGWQHLYDQGWITGRRLTDGQVVVMLTDAGRQVLEKRDAMRRLAGEPIRQRGRHETK